MRLERIVIFPAGIEISEKELGKLRHDLQERFKNIDKNGCNKTKVYFQTKSKLTV